MEPSEEVSMCSFHICMENRRLAVRNIKQFDCKHLQLVKDSSSLSGYQYNEIHQLINTLI